MVKGWSIQNQNSQIKSVCSYLWFSLLYIFLCSASHNTFANDRIFENQIKMLRDPTRPLVEKFTAVEGVQVDYVLNAIFVRSTGNKAVINGVLVGENDIVGEAKVKQIGSHRVSYELDGELLSLVLRPKIIGKSTRTTGRPRGRDD